MKFILAAFVFSMVSFAHAATPEKSVEDSLRAQFTEFTTAWNNGDAKTVASFWADDGTLIDPVGTQAKGRAEIQKVIEETFPKMKSSKTELRLESVRKVTPTVVLADCTHEFTNMTMPDGKTVPSMKAHVVALAVKKGGKWWWEDVRPYFFQPKEMGNKQATAQ
jgi:uncharacterized protein (TIGR02246 family)